MNNRDQNGINALLREKINHRRWMALLLVLALVVSSSTFWMFRHNAIAATYKKRVLACQFESGTVAHVHNDDCFHDGELVCGLEEIEPHLHSDDCYEAVLSCGLEENDGHVHDDTCWVEETNLICGIDEHVHDDSCFESVLICDEDEAAPEYDEAGELVDPGHQHDESCYESVLTCELPEHTHDDSCWETDRYLVCGMEEGDGAHQHDETCYESVLICGQEELPVHMHDANCFITVDLTAEEVAAMNDERDEDSPEETEEPATFSALAGDILVSVEADFDAFPAGTEMIATPVYDEEVIGAVADAVDGRVIHVQAVDISFFFDGEEIEPAKPIRVTMTPVEMPEADEQLVVHVDHAGETEVVEQQESEATEVIFEAESFSVYAIVYTVTIEKTVLASDGETYRITLSYTDDAGIPENAELAVEEMVSESYEALLSEAEETVSGEGKIEFARFFDITILADGEPVQPLVPVQVKIDLISDVNTNQDAEPRIIHFGEETEVLEAEAVGDTVFFDAQGFSVYGVVYTVDFSYSVNGKMYGFSLPGGGFVSFTNLIEVLGRRICEFHKPHRSAGYN